MEIVQAAMVATEISHPVEVQKEEMGNAEPDAENQLPPTDTKEEAPQTLPADEKPEDSK